MDGVSTMSKRSFLIPIILGIVLAAFGWAPGLWAGQRTLIKEGDLFPDVALKTPPAARDKAYLGISGGESFTVKDIKAKLILVEIMNVYCSACQNQAPIYNKLFDLIQSNPKLRNLIKMVGVSAGNNAEEIKIYQDHFKVPFPIIPDPKYVMHAAIGGSPTPFSIFVRRVSKAEPAVVADTHLGYDGDYKGMLKRMLSLLAVDLEELRIKGAGTKATVITVKLPISEEALESKLKTAFTAEGGQLTGFGKVGLSKGREIYTGEIGKDGKEYYLFAEVVSQKPTCDVCHDYHFIYIFDSSGKILQFIPIQLSKYGNVPWDEADVDKMRRKIVGRYIYNPFPFNGRVDAVTSATITSAGIFNELNQGQTIYQELKDKGLI